MKMGLTIKSEISKQFLLEEDAVKGFKKAVENNQVRLAMQVLTEIVDAYTEAFELLLESEEDPKIEEIVGSKIEEVKEEKKITAKKVKAEE